MIRNVKADLCGRSIFTFLRINYTAFNSVFAGFQSTDREHEFSFFLQPWQHLVSVIFSFILTSLIGVKWNLKMVLMVIHQTNKDVEYFKRYFLVILISLRNNLLRSITNVFIGSFVLKILFFYFSIYLCFPLCNHEQYSQVRKRKKSPKLSWACICSSNILLHEWLSQELAWTRSIRVTDYIWGSKASLGNLSMCLH